MGFENSSSLLGGGVTCGNGVGSAGFGDGSSAKEYKEKSPGDRTDIYDEPPFPLSPSPLP